jgi:hypothetical protein
MGGARGVQILGPFREAREGRVGARGIIRTIILACNPLRKSESQGGRGLEIGYNEVEIASKRCSRSFSMDNTGTCNRFLGCGEIASKRCSRSFSMEYTGT